MVKGDLSGPKVAIVTDSIACLTRELTSQYDIHVLPINLYIGDKVYRDGVDISPTEVYQLFLEDPEHFNTSAPSPAVWSAPASTTGGTLTTVTVRVSVPTPPSLSVTVRITV